MNLKPFFLILLVACVTVQAQVPEKRAYTYLEQMDEIMKSVPGYWKTSLEDIETTAARVKKGTARLLCMSAGNRPVYGMFYGKPNELKRSANLSSAMGAGNMKHYADKSAQDYKPTLFLVGAVHGGELEGTAALMNLVKPYWKREKILPGRNIRISVLAPKKLISSSSRVQIRMDARACLYPAWWDWIMNHSGTCHKVHG